MEDTHENREKGVRYRIDMGGGRAELYKKVKGPKGKACIYVVDTLSSVEDS